MVISYRCNDYGYAAFRNNSVLTWRCYSEERIFCYEVRSVVNDLNKRRGPDRFDRLKVNCVAAGIALLGPLSLAFYFAQLVRGEFSSRTSVLVSYAENPISFYVTSVAFGACALLLTTVSVLFAIFLWRGRSSK